VFIRCVGKGEQAAATPGKVISRAGRGYAGKGEQVKDSSTHLSCHRQIRRGEPIYSLVREVAKPVFGNRNAFVCKVL
jgi:hypothetical protein